MQAQSWELVKCTLRNPCFEVHTLSLMLLQLCVCASTPERRSRATLERTRQVVSSQLEPLHKSTRTRLKKWRVETPPGSPSSHCYCWNSRNDTVEISRNQLSYTNKMISRLVCWASSGVKQLSCFLALSYAHWLPFSLQTATANHSN